MPLVEITCSTIWLFLKAVFLNAKLSWLGYPLKKADELFSEADFIINISGFAETG